MPVHVHLLDAADAFGAMRERLAVVFDATVARVGEQLPLGPVDVVVYLDPRFVIPEIGIGGYAPSRDRVLIALDLHHPHLHAHFDAEFGAMLGHELHHCVRWAGPGYGPTLAEAVVSEGLACCFEVQFRGGEQPFYARPLAAQDRARVRAAFLEQRDRPGYDHQAWFYGSGEWPRHAGYALGREIVERHLLRHGGSPAGLAQAPAAAFLADIADGKVVALFELAAPGLCAFLVG